MLCVCVSWFMCAISVQLIVRESAVEALRAALAVTSQRETKNSQRSQWYKVPSVFHFSVRYKTMVKSIS